MDFDDVRSLLRGIGETPEEDALHKFFDVADVDHNGFIDLQEFTEYSDFIVGDNPARIILVVGGPGSGKGVLCIRLQEECHVVHLSSGDMLRHEVASGSSLGKQVRGIMARGELVSSAIMVALMKRRMRQHPGKRVLLDGFPRSAENAQDLVTLCGKPELALHLACDDTVLLERIIGRGADLPADERRQDDNFQTALERLRTFHKHHTSTMEWLREQHVPIVNLDCSSSSKSVWQQLQAIGRVSVVPWNDAPQRFVAVVVAAECGFLVFFLPTQQPHHIDLAVDLAVDLDTRMPHDIGTYYRYRTTRIVSNNNSLSLQTIK